ncbi:hypothetical protein AMAG_15676 [Allomyces macrogynus ATCC 38327]|uniref:Signal recognition particle receptor subunit alpha homolog n=1 Tax=Allomyces macrogynus (strain ATCC 38327) TaxID=578462 RepID=A0A0L0T9G1_ALLM3|nr:hypothetical protein AMAG_15676 [Allomyces macrogynus ATCC 38327]|eukprot:KNE71443.1 hypothetical protein AMAG_15676 [Allomyces macrogynus ATCC 38327]
MLDFFTILTMHGLVLYDRSFSPVLSSSARRDAVNALLAHQLLVGPTDTFTVGAMTLRARTAPPLVLIAAYPKAVEARYAPALPVAMDKVARSLCADLINEVAVAWTVPVDRARELESAFMRELDKAENAVTKPVGSRKPLGGVNRSASAASVGDQGESDVSAASDASPGPGAPRPLGGVSPVGGRRMPVQRRKNRGRNAPGGGDESDPATPPLARKGKAARKWDDSSISAEDAQSLDYSSSSLNLAADARTDSVEHLVDQASLGRTNRDGSYVPQELGNPSATASSKLPAFLTSVQNLFSTSRALTRADLEPVLAKMENHLIGKNVAAEVTRDLLESVAVALEGKRIGWTSIYQHIRQALEDRLQRILLPSAGTDLLRDLQDVVRGEHRPYVMVMCGVNGVGKSTNLAKITFWLLQNRVSVLIAACDTFRSGAVEQLRTHVRNLRALVEQLGHDDVKIELFERGYGKDAAGIAKEATNYAKANGFQTVLVDTAGRMQDNEPLMRSLAKLTALNRPDKIVFVGEALADPRDIDALLLTKFDLIADKVGAAVSMTYITRRPILFVGTGQTYTDLKRINVQVVVDALLAA